MSNIYLPDVRDVLGWLTIEEQVMLQSVVFWQSGIYGDLVEIGSYCGRSAVVIGSALAQGCCGTLWCVDPHVETMELYGVDSYEMLVRNLDGYKLGEVVKVVKKTSEDASLWWGVEGKKVKLLFIDGDHEYEAVRKDWDCWSHRVCKRGVVMFHDSEEEGPAKVVSEVRGCGSEWQEVFACGSLRGFVRR